METASAIQKLYDAPPGKPYRLEEDLQVSPDSSADETLGDETASEYAKILDDFHQHQIEIRTEDQNFDWIGEGGMPLSKG